MAPRIVLCSMINPKFASTGEVSFSGVGKVSEDSWTDSIYRSRSSCYSIPSLLLLLHYGDAPLKDMTSCFPVKNSVAYDSLPSILFWTQYFSVLC